MKKSLSGTTSTPYFIFVPARLGRCASSPCQNGGSCNTNDDHNRMCACSDGFDGDFCERGEVLETQASVLRYDVMIHVDEGEISEHLVVATSATASLRFVILECCLLTPSAKTRSRRTFDAK